MNFNQLEQSRSVAEDHMKHLRHMSDENRLLAEANPAKQDNQPVKDSRFRRRRWFSFLWFGRRDPGQT